MKKGSRERTAHQRERWGRSGHHHLSATLVTQAALAGETLGFRLVTTLRQPAMLLTLKARLSHATLETVTNPCSKPPPSHHLSLAPLTAWTFFILPIHLCSVSPMELSLGLSRFAHLKGKAESPGGFCDYSGRPDSRPCTQSGLLITVGRLLFLKKHNQVF